jgi:hypothetical protein
MVEAPGSVAHAPLIATRGDRVSGNELTGKVYA